MSERLLVCDVDGPIYPGNLGVESVPHFVRHKVFTKETSDQIMDVFKNYKGGGLKKDEALKLIYQYYGDGLKGLDYKVVNQVADLVWNELKGNVCDYATDMINAFSDICSEKFLASGSPYMMVSRLGNDMGINSENVVAGKAEVVDGVYTGEVDFFSNGFRKLEGLRNLMSGRRYLGKAYYISDNISDVGLFEKVGHPIVFRTAKNLELCTLAQSRNWPVVSRETIVDDVSRIVDNSIRMSSIGFGYDRVSLEPAVVGLE